MEENRTRVEYLSSHQHNNTGRRPDDGGSPPKGRDIMKRSITTITAGVCALALVAGACGSDDDAASDDTTVETAAPDDAGGDEAATDNGADAAAGDCETTDSVSLQLQWFTQAQFGGYYAAADQGFYADQCLDVEIKEGAVEIVPQAELASGDADFAIAWVPKALQTREAGADIVNIAQVFERSGTLQVSFADNGIDVAGRLRRQGHRQLGLRQRVRGVRCNRRGGSRPGHRRRTRRPAVRHDRSARR